MKRRERILAISAGSILGVTLAYLLANRLVMGPAVMRRDQADALRVANSELERDNRRMAIAKDQFARLRNRTFEDNPLHASLLAESRINELVKRAGIGQKDVTVRPFTQASGTARDFSEVGCTIGGNASLERITNLLYLLKNDPYLHRVSNVEITPKLDGKSFDFSLRYLTPIFDRPLPVTVEARKPATTQMAEGPALSDAGRSAYDVICKRNLFQPYVPPVPQVARRETPTPQERPPREARSPRQRSSFDSLVVTGLPSRGDEAEVHLTMPGQDAERVFKVGETLPVGRIVMVDYRVLPHPDDPKLLSTSRLILRIGQDYWRVELGQQIQQRRVLRSTELPEELKPKPARVEATATTRPAEQT